MKRQWKHFLAEAAVEDFPDCRYVDVGALYGTVGETISTAAKFTSDLHVIDLYSLWWEPLLEHLSSVGVTATCEYHCGDVLCYEDEPFDVTFCGGVIYHMPDPDQLWGKLRQITRKRLAIYSLTVPPRILASGRVSTEDEHNCVVKAAREFLLPKLPGIIFPPFGGEQYAPMHWIYSVSGLVEEAQSHGWRVVLDCTWHGGLFTGLILEP